MIEIQWFPLPRNIKAGLNWRFLNSVVFQLVKTKRASVQTEERPKDILDLLITARDEDTGFQLTDADLSAHVKTYEVLLVDDF